MSTQANKSRYLPLLITAIAVILFSTAGIARMMGWGPNSTDESGDILALDVLPVASAKPVAVTAQMVPGQVAGDARAKGRCPECGVSLLVAGTIGFAFMTWLQSRFAGVNAAVLFIALLFFGWLWGAWGLLLGAPLIAIAKVVCDRVDSLKPAGELLGR